MRSAPEQAARRDVRLRPHRGTPLQPHVRDARRRARGDGRAVYLRPETAQGIFINFKNVAQIARASRRSVSPRSASRSATRSPRATSSSARSSSSRWRWSSSSRRPRPTSGTATGCRRATTGTGATGSGEPSPDPPARRRRALPLLERDERHRVPVPDRLVGARGRREPRRLRSHRPHERVRDEARVGRAGRLPLHAPCDRTRPRRQPLDARIPRRCLRRGGRGRPRPYRAPPSPAARARQGGDPAADRQERGYELQGPQALRGAARDHLGRVRRRGSDRPSLPAPGRDRHAVCATIDEQTVEDDTITIRERDSLAQERISISRARSTCSTGSRLRGARRRPLS